MRAKELVCLKCAVISGARNESHLACNHKARISSYLGRGIAEMRIAECGMRIVKEYNSEIRNPKSEIWMADACGAICLSFRALAGLS